jgi:hypothetical protein
MIESVADVAVPGKPQWRHLSTEDIRAELVTLFSESSRFSDKKEAETALSMVHELAYREGLLPAERALQLQALPQYPHHRNNGTTQSQRKSETK